MKTNFWQKVILVNAASIAAIAATLVGVESSLAQSQTTCESQDFRRVSCPINTRNGVELYQQNSQTSCRGKWGFGRGSVWVEDGCRATFRSLDDQDARQDERRNRWDERNDRRSESRDNYEELNKIYRDVLDRDIDRRGFRMYSQRIREGWPLSRVRKEVARSSEAREEINRIYRNRLGRDADQDGLRTYQKRLEDGWSLRRVEGALANSEEARQRRRN